MIRTVTAMQPNASPTAAAVADLLKEGHEGPNRMHVHIMCIRFGPSFL